MTKKKIQPEKNWEDELINEVLGTGFFHSQECRATELFDYRCNCSLKGDLKILLDFVKNLLHLERQKLLAEVMEKVIGEDEGPWRGRTQTDLAVMYAINKFKAEQRKALAAIINRVKGEG